MYIFTKRFSFWKTSSPEPISGVCCLWILLGNCLHCGVRLHP